MRFKDLTPEAEAKRIEAVLRKRMGDEAYDAYQAKLISDGKARMKAKNAWAIQQEIKIGMRNADGKLILGNITDG